jgi:hypothetical protein
MRLVVSEQYRHQVKSSGTETDAKAKYDDTTNFFPSKNLIVPFRISNARTAKKTF